MQGSGCEKCAGSVAGQEQREEDEHQSCKEGKKKGHANDQGEG